MTVKIGSIFPLATDSEARVEESKRPTGLKDFSRLKDIPLEMAMRFAPASALLRDLQQAASAASDAESRASAFLQAGRIREALREWEAACLSYEGAVACEPRDRETAYFAHNNLGYCLNRLGRSAAAERECRNAIAIDAERFNAHKNLGIALESQGRASDAAECYHRAAAANPGDTRAARRLRILLAQHPEIAASRPRFAADVREWVAPPEKARPTQDPRPLEDRLRFALNSARVAEALEVEGLQIFGLTWDVSAPVDYRTLDDALADGALEIMEISEEGRVSTIRIVNRGDLPVFLMAGEHVVGAKQNRVINTSMLVGSRSELPLPVSCVEQGRWSERASRFGSSKSSSHAALKHLMMRHVHASYRSRGTPTSDQREVWQEVGRVLDASATRSPSSALHDLYEAQESRLETLGGAVALDPEWRGAAFARDGAIVGVDLFDRASTFAKLWPKLIRAYGLEVTNEASDRGVERSEVERWIRSSSSGVMDTYRSLGTGHDVRFEGHGVVGAALMAEDAPIHLEMFFDHEV